MKSLSKLIPLVLTITAFFFIGPANAQTTPAGGLRMSIGFDAGIPTNNLRISSNLVLGGTINLQYGITNSFAVTLTSGADHFLSKPLPGTNFRYDSFGMIPVKVGFRKFFVQNIYFAAQAGVGWEQVDSGHANTKFILSPALGYANEHWDVSARFENFLGENDYYGFVALRVAYGFRFLSKK